MPTLTDTFATLADPAAPFEVPSVSELADDDLIGGVRLLLTLHRGFTWSRAR